MRQPFTLNGLRYYDPSVGRFLTRDPIGYEGGINLYTFCGNNPVNHIDPGGTEDDGGPEIPISEKKLFKEFFKTIHKTATVAKTALGTAADLHPFAPLGKALTGKDSYGNKLSGGERLFNG